MDLKIRKFRNDLISLINATEISLEVKRLVINEVQKIVTEAADNYIASQQQKEAEEAKEDDNTEH